MRNLLKLVFGCSPRDWAVWAATAVCVLGVLAILGLAGTADFQNAAGLPGCSGWGFLLRMLSAAGVTALGALGRRQLLRSPRHCKKSTAKHFAFEGRV